MAMLFDQFGREVQVKKQPETREIAVTTIRDRWSNYPSGGLTPQSLATIFKEADMGDVARQAELFEEMEEKDAHLFSQIQTRKNAVTGLDYDVTAWSDAAEDKKIRDFVADCIFAMDAFEETELHMLDAIGKGYSQAELMWQIDSGRAVIDDIRWIHAKKAVFYERGAASQWQKSCEIPRILTEAQPINGEEMPPFKLVYHRYKARSGYDTRAGLLRIVAWMYLFKNYAIKDWVAFAEVFGMPLRLGKYDPAASREDKDALRAAIYSLGSDAAGIISKNTEIEFVEAVKNAGTNNIYEALANFCDAQMSKAILGQTATTEGTPGRLGNEDAQDRVRHDLIRADAEALANTIRGQIIRPLVGFNFGWDKPLPWFKIFHERPEDTEKLSVMYKNLHEMGQPISVEHVADRFKVPLPQEGETPLPAPAARNNAPIAAKNKPSGDDLTGGRVVIAKAASDPSNEDTGAGTAIDPADVIAERLGKDSLAAMDAMIAPLQRLVNEAADLEDLRDRIIDLYQEMSPADLGTIIARAMLLAEASGRLDIREEASL
jgi:phage gp29-like protein